MGHSITAESDYDLPDGWLMARLSEVAHARLGKTPRRGDYRDHGVHRIVKFRDLIEFRDLDYSNTKNGYVVNEPDALMGLRELKLNDVLVTASAHSGDQIGKKCGFVKYLPEADGNIYFVGELLGITSDMRVMSASWPRYWFMSAHGQEAIQNAVAGVHLTAGRAQGLPIPLPPLVEQGRIVAKLEEVLARVNNARERLARVPAILKRFRQSVLDAACSGRLTADWRARSTANPTPADDGEIPVSWAVSSLGRLSTLVTSGSRGWAEYYAETGPSFVRA